MGHNDVVIQRQLRWSSRCALVPTVGGTGCHYSRGSFNGGEGGRGDTGKVRVSYNVEEHCEFILFVYPGGQPR